jgi:hypothetical protein
MAKSNRIEDFLFSSRIMIENSLRDEPLKQALAVYGYTEEKLNQGKELYNKAEKLHLARKMEYGEQIAATAELDTVWDQAEKQYMKTLKIARVALKEDVRAYESTMLFGDRKRSLSGWLEQARAFYTNLLGDSGFLNALSAYGYTQAKLEKEAALVDQVIAKHMAQKKEMGEAQEATAMRDKALDNLAKWISDFRAVVKVALEEDPQQLEKLGILARS